MMSEDISLPDYEMSVGLVTVDGVGLRVSTAGAEGVRHMSAAAARRLAKTLEDGEHGAALRPVAAALRAKADELDAIHGLRDAEPAGRA